MRINCTTYLRSVLTRRLWLSWLVCALLTKPLMAQVSTEAFQAKNTIFAELGGKGALYSINYDRIICQGPKLFWSLRVGTMYIPESSVFGSSLFLPIGLNAFTGKGNHHLEFSIGETLRIFPGYKTDDQKVRWKFDYPFTFIGVGYRYQKPAGGLYVSATLLPSLRPFRGVDGLRVEFLPWVGVGIGRSF